MPSFTLDDLTDEQRQKLLEDFAPSPISTDPITRGAQGFSQLPLPKSIGGDAFTTPPARQGIDPDVFARFAEAQQRGAKLNALNALGHGFGADAGLISGTGVNTIARDPSRRGQAVQDLSTSLSAQRQLSALDRQRELDTVNLAKTRADTRKAEASATANEAEAKREAALADPNSQESKALRATASELLRDRITPETLATMSGTQIRDALKYGTSMVNAEALANFRQSQLDLTAAQNAFNNQLARWRAGLEQDRLDQDWDKFQLTLEQQLELEKLRAERDAKKREQDRGDKLSEREVGGYHFAEGRTPSLDGAKKMAAAAEQIGKIRRSLTNLRSMYSKHGTELFGERAGLMESEFMAITNAARVMNDMGVPNGKDYEMLAKELQDPTTVKDLFTSKGRNLAKMDLLMNRMVALEGDTAKIYGYERENAPPPRVGSRENPSPAKTTYGGPVGSDVTPERAKRMVAANSEKYSLKPFPPEKIRKKQYSKSRNETRIVDGNGKVISTEEGDTRGQ